MLWLITIDTDDDVDKDGDCNGYKADNDNSGAIVNDGDVADDAIMIMILI
uniref:Uncharacterized protein n=1 Tax=Setaria digitata TaxID=48799 RepID=A0A915PJF5_9BILA